MTNYEKREEKALDTIAKKITKLEEHIATMEETDSKVKHYFAQEEAIHDIRSITRHIAKIAKLEDKADAKEIKEAEKLTEEEIKAITDIDKEFDKLETTLEKLDDSENKVKSYLEQKKAIHEIKKLLKEAGKLEDIGEEPTA